MAMLKKKFEVMSDKFVMVIVSVSGNCAQKLNIKFYNTNFLFLLSLPYRIRASMRHKFFLEILVWF